MEVNCPQCKRKIEATNINVEKDTVFCSQCEVLTMLSSLLKAAPNNSFNKNALINGITLNDMGSNWTIEISQRSLQALFFIPFTIVWAGSSLSGLYGSQLLKGEFSLEQSLFGLPFLIGSIVLISLSLMSICGKTLVRVENGKGLIFIGIGTIGWYRRFDWNTVDRITENYVDQNKHISLEGRTRLNLGWRLSSKKLYYIANFLRTKLRAR